MVEMDTAAPMAMDMSSLAVLPTESATCRVKVNVPGEVGVPETTPLELMLSPPGKAPPIVDQK